MKQLKSAGRSKGDEPLLASLAAWRYQLAHDIAAYKSNRQRLNDALLNESVQRILDRLIFLRLCSAKRIEWEDALLSATQDWKTRGDRPLYAYLNEHFIERRRRFGLLFEPHPCEQLEVSDEVLLNILQELHSPLCDFGKLSPEVLGNIYENFLAETIRLTPSGVRIELKPEVRKSGGVYYTPKYIVDFIVENTVGRLLLLSGQRFGFRVQKTQPGLNPQPKSLTPEEISQLKIIDIACGSGAFLLGAYQALMDYHLSWYAEHPTGVSIVDGVPDVVVGMDGKPRLSMRKKRDILLANIFGVDIDKRAVEVTQMSLFLKMLEDEEPGRASPSQHDEMSKYVLSGLEENIRCGNALLGSDWQKEFPAIMSRGGFDCVIGNPPYGASLSERERTQLNKAFGLQTTDTAALMMKQAHAITRDCGLNGFIIPKPFTYASNWKKTRDLMLTDLELVADCGKVWKNVKLEQVIYVAKKCSQAKEYVSAVRRGEEFCAIGNVSKEACSEFGFILNGLSEEEIQVGTKMRAAGRTLGEIIVNRRGGGFQSELRARGRVGVLGGKQIGRYSMQPEPKGYIAKLKDDGKSRIKANSVLAQNIVAHIRNPVDHIEIIATVVPKAEAARNVILDTINQLECVGYSNRFVLALLCSRLMNWYVYRFVFAKAIRTMHFDAVVTDRLPLPKLDLSIMAEKKVHDHLAELADQMFVLNRKLRMTSRRSESISKRIDEIDEEIDRCVYGLYGLTASEVSVVFTPSLRDG
ncbi:MAG: N-6 DNA methylase [Ignavibacteriae bacterium]|nr:N-6 DNA methylase [Ignavibacteriota bacterium]